MNRRYFIAASAAGGLGQVLRASPNDTVRVACVGVRGRGHWHLDAFAKMPNVEIVAVCDIDEGVLNGRLEMVEKMGKKRPAPFTDIRKMLEDKSIDVVSIATPNHSHTLQTIWACQAGKDVYVEKPCSHNVFESQQIVAAARKYGRIVQHGTQTRSSEAVREGFERLREGIIGDVYMARGLCINWRDTIGRAKPEPVPAGVHYDMWMGPAPVKPFTSNRLHYKWHWQWDYGHGDIGNQGIHEMDVCRWGLGVTYPTKVSAIGGHFMFDDDQETPNTLTATFEFDNAGKKQMLVFEVRHWISNSEAGVAGSRGIGSIGNIFYGSKGYLVRDGSTYRTFLGKEQAPGPSHPAAEPTHFANFIQAVRTRKRSDLNAEIEEGAVSCVLVNLANISYRLGRTLHFDAKTMTCVGDAEANRMFTRDYRVPYVVPKNV